MSKSARLKGRLLKVSDVGMADIVELFSIFERYYQNVSLEAFQRDFFEKSHVIVLQESATKKIRGFTTLKTFEVTVGGHKVLGLFSGDTVIERDFWGQSALRSAFCRVLIKTWWENLWTSLGSRPCYWFLISKGYKTYLLMTNNFPTHWPRFDRSTPKFEREVIRRFAEHLYPGRVVDRSPAAFSERAGDVSVLKFDEGAPCLRESVAPIREDLLKFSNVRFFESANPDWRNGHELCCLAPIGPAVFLKFVAKFIGQMVLNAIHRVRSTVRNRKPIALGGAVR